ncbi:membrane protein [Agaricicola taiwanensis]|uniref:Membrane protein n=1 Tax=Agaricicola taiwanensis TaxID=591372 RepID=A0A8J2YKB7_9RHOB|nr:tripartite tricarboxylate transporter TctB family protein [Agaricicola taiwanensis]GGE48436.1 membrane protein [Agaricicola taiwanensis]
MEQAKISSSIGEMPIPDESTENPAIQGRSHFLAGLMFAAIAAAALFVSRDYTSGSAVNMGPGYFPRLLASGLLILGLLLMARSFRAGGWDAIGAGARPLVCILGAILVFAFAIEPLGLFVTCMLSVLVAAFAQPRVNWPRVTVIALALATACSLVFGYALSLSLAIWPG